MLRIMRKRLGLEGLRHRWMAAKLRREDREVSDAEAQAFYAAQEVSAQASRAYQARRRKAAS
ncbi:hypothetical protein [Longimicrobium sp.]|uniref:hypothetical protein n=1 Tax=Longimicrobium sp. TaxID=2029185 RepID=UPI002C2A54A6|nr:hypothetical protein [Longimicrobium sp.]HSU17867.1 hypothetical protein [Longimicrobium sp.]